MSEYEKWRVFLSAAQLVATILSPIVAVIIIERFRK